jgi:uncharacterized protein (DUF849 family)
MTRSIVITCAITGGGDTVGKHPAIPITPAQIAQSAIEASAAGAAVVHIHVRDPQTGQPSLDPSLYREVVQRVRDGDSDVIINLTTGEGGLMRVSAAIHGATGLGATVVSPATRAAHVCELCPDMCSLDMGSLNFGDDLFINTTNDIMEIARLVAETDTRIELEVFDTGHIQLARHLLNKKVLASPPLFQLCLGIPWGAPANAETVLLMRNSLPTSATWAAFGIGVAQFPMVAIASVLGGHTRVGLEDNLYLERGVLAPSNAALVERAVSIIENLGDRVASKDQARTILDIAESR